jgi:adenine-specific DNA-methyltransferase
VRLFCGEIHPKPKLITESNEQRPETSNDEVGQGRSLQVLCSAFRGKSDRSPNLTIKKIPNAVLKSYEWGHDDYSLRVENLPKAPIKPGQLPLFGEEMEL